VKPWLAKLGDVDGVLMIPLSQPTPPLRAVLEGLPVPGLFFSRPYATHAWSSIADLRKSGRKVDVIATSSYGDLDPYMRAFRTAHHLRRSKVLVGAASPGGRQAAMDAYNKHFGTTFKLITGPEFRQAFDAADERQAQREADEFTRGALRVVEPSPKEIRDGLRFYLALKDMLKREQANALTIDCFGTLAANTLPGYPCIAWSKFNDGGLYGVCEADLPSTMTQMLVTSYTGMPGFVSDPVFDISRNEVIHAHCVSATKMKGINGPSYPYILRNHLETNEGAVVQVLMPSNETITVARFTSPSRLLISTAEVTGPVVDSDRGCRSQIRTRVSDAEKWLQNFTAGLHRVIFYGDHVRTVERMGRLLGFQVVHEF
jgi:L-fucose isomerase-like protein